MWPQPAAPRRAWPPDTRGAGARSAGSSASVAADPTSQATGFELREARPEAIRRRAPLVEYGLGLGKPREIFAHGLHNIVKHAIDQLRVVGVHRPSVTPYSPNLPRSRAIA